MKFFINIKPIYFKPLSQENLSNSIKKYSIIHSTRVIYLRTMLNYLKRRKKKQFEVLRALLFYQNCYKNVFPSMNKIAAKTNQTRRNVIRAVHTLKALGFVTTEYKHYKPLRYFVHEDFKDRSIREQLRDLIQECRWFTIGLLLSISALCSHYSSYSSPVTQNYYKYNNNRDVYIYSDLKYKDKGTEASKKVSKLKIQKGCKHMKHAIPMPEILKSIPELRLTRWGQIKLSAFSEEVLTYAADKMKFHTIIKNPFGLFFKLCLQYCASNHIKPDWNYANNLARIYKMPPNAILSFEAKELKQPSSKKVYKEHTYTKDINGAKYKPWKPQDIIEVNKEEEKKKIDEARKTAAWQALEKRWGITICPDAPAYLYKKK